MRFTSLTFLTFRHVRGQLKARSIFGWTPGLRTGVGGRMLSCGCLAGTYEAWSGAIVELIDEHAPHCPEQHEDNMVVSTA